jgi:hypothetical protein
LLKFESDLANSIICPGARLLILCSWVNGQGLSSTESHYFTINSMDITWRRGQSWKINQDKGSQSVSRPSALTPAPWPLKLLPQAGAPSVVILRRNEDRVSTRGSPKSERT